MKNRRRVDVVSWNRLFWCTLVVVFLCILYTGFSSVRILFPEKFRPGVLNTWRVEPIEATSGDSPEETGLSIREAVILPDQVLVFLDYPRPSRLFTKQDLDCVYFSANSSRPQLRRPPTRIEGENFDDQIVRCPINPRGFSVGLLLKSGRYIQPGPTHLWDSLAYEAMIDRDNTTIVFVKGLNLRADKVYHPSRFECVYGWDFTKPKFLLRSDVISIAQEIVRCKTPLSLLNTPLTANNSIKASVRVKGRGTVETIARPGHWSLTTQQNPSTTGKIHEMCVCTMLRNQARFLKEWVMYHAQIGVQRWFIYDNNSDDDIEDVVESLAYANYDISRHVWPWIKTQESGFAHCALRAREQCEWVGFIDVDEFFHLPSGLMLPEVLKNQSELETNVAELRVSCYSFGPSGLKQIPPKGVMTGYTCRLAVPERHKSIVKPEALNSTLINVVHHFHLQDGYSFVNADRGLLVINHYKYQVWEVFKEKFYRRVATYVADWQNEVNAGSKDRAPGLGTRAIEPPDWSSRFCEVTDTELKDRVVEQFMDPFTELLPWEEVDKRQLEGRILVQRNSTESKV